MSNLILHICYNLLYDKKSRNWYREVATIHFNFTFDMPALDKRTRGYLPTYIKELQESVGGEW